METGRPTIFSRTLVLFWPKNRDRILKLVFKLGARTVDELLPVPCDRAGGDDSARAPSRLTTSLSSRSNLEENSSISADVTCWTSPPFKASRGRGSGADEGMGRALSLFTGRSASSSEASEPSRSWFPDEIYLQTRCDFWHCEHGQSRSHFSLRLRQC